MQHQRTINDGPWEQFPAAKLEVKPADSRYNSKESNGSKGISFEFVVDKS